MPISTAHSIANKKYDEKAYDRISVLLPKGTKDRIRATGRSVNGLVSRATCAELDRVEKGLASVCIPQELYGELLEYGDPSAIATDAIKEKLREISI